MQPLRTLFLTTCTTLLVLAAQGCSKVTHFESEPQALGSGTVRSYVELDQEDQPKEVGIILTESALADLPDQATEVVLPLPAQAETTAISHISLDWRSHGHDPSPIYGLPHFDVHAYTLTPEEREAITATGADLETAYKTPDSDLIPTGYVLAPDSAEPRMGAHWVNPASEELQDTPHGFAHTLIYGFYNGEMAFVEPMVALDFLKSQQAFEGDFPAPQNYSKAGSYPTAYRITYNEETKEHTVALINFSQM